MPSTAVTFALSIVLAATGSALPERRPATKASATYRGAPGGGRPARAPAQAPSNAERRAVAKSLVGNAVVVGEKLWASVDVRAPFRHGRASLVFVGADRVDPPSGWARFPAGAPDPSEFQSGGMRVIGDIEGLAGGIDPTSHQMELWIHARPGHRYAATCRVRLDGSVGEVIVQGDGGFELKNAIDHTGKTTGRVSFLVDPGAEGWYGFTIVATKTWATNGCWVDEI